MTDNSREAVSRLIYCCSTGQFHDDTPGECPDSGVGDHPTHRLRKIRNYVCSVCTQAYKLMADFKQHECGDML